MDNDVAISVGKVYKSFRLPHEQHSGLKQYLLNIFRSKKVKSYEEQHVLEDISFEIKNGEFFGVVGRNGSGKSTLLKLLAGIYTPENGLVQVNGSLTPFIELGVGFNPELTGRENVFLNGALLGFSKKEVEVMYDDIVDFAELEPFMDQKLKNYSSGMQVRLAFSIAVRSKSDILLLDEVLAVGDLLFQKKCYDYFKQLKKEKRTVVFISHDSNALQEYCDRGVLIERGKILKTGRIDKVLQAYSGLLNESEGLKTQTEISNKKRWGSGDITIEKVDITQPAKGSVFQEKDALAVQVEFRARKDIEDGPVYGLTINDGSGQVIFQSNTLWCHKPTKAIKKGDLVKVEWNIPNCFNSGTYFAAPAVSDATGTRTFDWVEEAARFEVSKQQKSHAYINVEHTLTVVEP